MKVIPLTHFRKHLTAEVERCQREHEPLLVTRRQGESFVVLSLADWTALEETLALYQVPGLVASLQQAAQEPLAEGVPLDHLVW